jgi:hypothetical protein
MHRQCKLILHCYSISIVYSAKSPYYSSLQLYDMEKCLISIDVSEKLIYTHRTYLLNSIKNYLKLYELNFRNVEGCNQIFLTE